MGNDRTTSFKALAFGRGFFEGKVLMLTISALMTFKQKFHVFEIVYNVFINI